MNLFQQFSSPDFLFPIWDNLELLSNWFVLGFFVPLQCGMATMSEMKSCFQEYKCLHKSLYITTVLMLMGKFALFSTT